MTETPSDEDLMMSYRTGDAAAFAELYRRNKDGLFRFILRQCRSRALAEELFQDVWLKLIKARHRYRPSAGFRTYLFKIARHRLIDHYRQAGRMPAAAAVDDRQHIVEQAAPVQQQPDHQAQMQETLSALVQAVEALPPEQREVFLLREEAGLSVDDIARVVEINAEAVKSRLRYALKKVRSSMVSKLEH